MSDYKTFQSNAPLNTHLTLKDDRALLIPPVLRHENISPHYIDLQDLGKEVYETTGLADIK